jgi:hypothetical protein
MLRRLRKLALVHGKRLVSLVLLPAFLLGTLPQIACICSAAEGQAAGGQPACPTKPRGERETRCSALATGDNCCQPSATPVEPSCCQPKQAANQLSSPEPLARCGGCCHQVIAPPAPAQTQKKSGALKPQAVDFVIVELPWPSVLADAQGRFTLGVEHAPPPLDLVVVLRRLTI